MFDTFQSNTEQFTLSVSHQHSADRADVEQFIAQRFADKLDASIQNFMPTLLVVKDRAENIVAACGLRSSAEERLFLEDYLDTSIQQEIAKAAKRSAADIDRQEVAEIGNLASANFAASRFLFKALFDYCQRQHFSWVVFTSCQRLLTAFTHLGLSLVKLADARESSLTTEPGTWGRYYQDAPAVMAGQLQSAATLFNTSSDTASGGLHV
jgi:hypothetical protein